MFIIKLIKLLQISIKYYHNININLVEWLGKFYQQNNLKIFLHKFEY